MYAVSPFSVDSASKPLNVVAELLARLLEGELEELLDVERELPLNAIAEHPVTVTLAPLMVLPGINHFSSNSHNTAPLTIRPLTITLTTLYWV